MTAISIYLILAAGLLVALALLAVASVVGRALTRQSGCRCGRDATLRIHHHPSYPKRTPSV